MIEKSAGAIIFRKEKNKIYYLLLYYPGISHRAEKNYWDFPKGHIEKGEKIDQTIKREVKEETGLEDIRFVNGFKETIKYFFKHKGKKILKFVTFYLAKTKEKEIKISPEHIDAQWFSFKEATKKLTFENSKEILKKANDFLNSKFKNQNAK